MNASSKESVLANLLGIRSVFANLLVRKPMVSISFVSELIKVFELIFSSGSLFTVVKNRYILKNGIISMTLQSYVVSVTSEIFKFTFLPESYLHSSGNLFISD